MCYASSSGEEDIAQVRGQEHSSLDSTVGLVVCVTLAPWKGSFSLDTEIVDVDSTPISGDKSIQSFFF